MKAKILLIVFVTLFGCSDDNPIVGSSNNDELLKSRLVGSWSAGNWYHIHYRVDNTYIDSVFIRSNADTNLYLLDIVMQGRYSITNGVLQRTDLQWFVADTSRYPGGLSAIPFSQEIEFSANRLLLKPVDVLSPTNGFGFGYQLWGSWAMTQWVYHRVDQLQVIYAGRQKYTYIFNRDSSHVRYGWEYLDGNPFPNPTFLSEFTYHPPFLDLVGPGWYHVRVEFKSGGMYWYYDSPPGQLTRDGAADSAFPLNQALNLMDGGYLPPPRENESLISAEGVYLHSGVVLRRLTHVR